ncbi:hypothetical protein H4R19_003926 [Coemansia spiralis]|nr:hypothetical protein H4R19_003926 [Coemansia spiralis]
MEQDAGGSPGDAQQAENDQVLEGLARNEATRIPWPELRRIVWQRLSQVVEQLNGTGSGDSPASTETRKRARAEGDDDAKDEAPAVAADVQLDNVDGGDAAVSRGAQPDQAAPAEEECEGGRASTAATEEMQAPAGSSDAEAAVPAAEEPQEASGRSTAEAHQIRELEDRISYTLHTFEEAPFTIQRIAELLAWPDRHYRSALKFLRAVERVVYVTSTVGEFPTTVQGPSESDKERPDDAIEQEEAAPLATAPPLSSFLTPAGPATPRPVDELSTTRPTSPGSTRGQPAAGRRAWPLSAQLASAASPIGLPPLDASDTGILHVRRSSAEDKDDLRSRIQGTVDVSVPVCIDEPDGTNGNMTVVPIHPPGASSPRAPSGGAE